MQFFRQTILKWMSMLAVYLNILDKGSDIKER